MTLTEWLAKNWYWIAMILFVMSLVNKNKLVNEMSNAVIESPLAGTLSVFAHFLVRGAVVIVVTVLFVFVIVVVGYFLNWFAGYVLEHWIPQLQGMTPFWTKFPGGGPTITNPLP